MKLYIARDKDETLWLFKEYPIKRGKVFYPTEDITGRFTYYRRLPTDILPEITFENSPQEVEIKLIEK